MALRASEPWRVPAAEAYLIIRAGDVMPVEEHTAFVEGYLAAAHGADRLMRDYTRVVVTGAFCEQPPLELIRTLERAGCYLVWDDFTVGARFLEGDVSLEGDPIEALAQAFLNQSVKNACVYEPDGKKGEWLVNTVRDTHADGVVFAAPSFCDPALLEQPMLVTALERAGIPHTSFKYAENLGQFQVIREQAGTFSDGLRLWSNA
jgi:benzoyl-CoA reductase subunit C